MSGYFSAAGINSGKKKIPQPANVTLKFASRDFFFSPASKNLIA